MGLIQKLVQVIKPSPTQCSVSLESIKISDALAACKVLEVSPDSKALLRQFENDSTEGGQYRFDYFDSYTGDDTTKMLTYDTQIFASDAFFAILVHLLTEAELYGKGPLHRKKTNVFFLKMPKDGRVFVIFLRFVQLSWSEFKWYGTKSGHEWYLTSYLHEHVKDVAWQKSSRIFRAVT